MRVAVPEEEGFGLSLMLFANLRVCTLEVLAAILPLDQWLQPGYLRTCLTRNVFSAPKPLSCPRLCPWGPGRGTEVCPGPLCNPSRG